MQIQYFHDSEIEDIAKANIDAFLADCRAEAGLPELSKHLRDVRQEQETDHAWNGFVESLESGPTGVDVRHEPRLRSEDRPDPDVDPLEKEDGGQLAKAAGAKQRALRLVKVLRRSATAYALGEEPSEHILEEFRAILMEK
jgi:hypothetical protein